MNAAVVWAEPTTAALLLKSDSRCLLSQEGRDLGGRRRCSNWNMVKQVVPTVNLYLKFSQKLQLECDQRIWLYVVYASTFANTPTDVQPRLQCVFVQGCVFVQVFMKVQAYTHVQLHSNIAFYGLLYPAAVAPGEDFTQVLYAPTSITAPL